MKDQLQIVKIGGKIINNAKLLHNFLQSFAKIKGLKILVHGGGRAATSLSEKMGLEVKLIEGRRVTDRETLDIAVMTYAGLINKQIVAQMQRLGMTSVGLSGADGFVIESVLRDKLPIDYGYVGDIKHVNTPFISTLLQMGIVPVFCPITCSATGQLLNTNADTIASSIATHLCEKYAIQLKYCFEYNGVLEDLKDPSSIIATVTQESARAYIQKGVFSDGMIPKIENAFKAVDAGIRSVHICGISHVHEEAPGTSFYQNQVN